MKIIEINTPWGQYGIPLQLIAEKRADYYACEVDGFARESPDWYAEVQVAIHDTYEAIDWFINNEDWDDWKDEAIKLSNKVLVTEKDFLSTSDECNVRELTDEELTYVIDAFYEPTEDELTHIWKNIFPVYRDDEMDETITESFWDIINDDVPYDEGELADEDDLTEDPVLNDNEYLAAQLINVDEIAELIKLHPNDQTLGQELRAYYYNLLEFIRVPENQSKFF